MKLNRFNICVALFLTSCASTPIQPAAILGPPPADEHSGYLQVFSPVEERQDWDRPVYYRHHVGYSVTTTDGKIVCELKNPAYTSQEDTLELVPLHPGKYVVKVNGKRLSVEVLIKSGCTTVVHLDGAWQPAANATNNDLVRLPGGQGIGWRAHPPEISNGSSRTN